MPRSYDRELEAELEKRQRDKKNIEAARILRERRIAGVQEALRLVSMAYEHIKIIPAPPVALSDRGSFIHITTVTRNLMYGLELEIRRLRAER